MVELARSPILSSCGPTLTPVMSRVTMKAVSLPRSSGLPVLAKTVKKLARPPLVIHSLLPLSTQSSPSRTAVVLTPAASEPGAGLGEAEGGDHLPGGELGVAARAAARRCRRAAAPACRWSCGRRRWPPPIRRSARSLAVHGSRRCFPAPGRRTSSGTTSPKRPNCRSSSRTAAGSSPATSQARKSFSRLPRSCVERVEHLPERLRSCRRASGKGRSTSSSMSPMHSERMKLVVSLSAMCRSPRRKFRVRPCRCEPPSPLRAWPVPTPDELRRCPAPGAAAGR